MVGCTSGPTRPSLPHDESAAGSGVAAANANIQATSGERVAQALAHLDDIYDSPLSERDKKLARYRPCDAKFVNDWASCGATRLWRHAKREFAAGRTGAGCKRLVGVPFAGAAGVLAVVPAGLGWWVGRAIARHRCKKGLLRTDEGLREDKLGRAVQALERTMASYKPEMALGREGRTYCMNMAGDVRQILWDLEHSLVENRKKHPRLAASSLIKKPLRHTVRLADKLDDARRSRA